MKLSCLQHWSCCPHPCSPSCGQSLKERVKAKDKLSAVCVCERERETDRDRLRLRESRKIKVSLGSSNYIFQFIFSLLTFSCCLNKNYFPKSEENTNIYNRTHIEKTHVNVYHHLADPAWPGSSILDCLFPP